MLIFKAVLSFVPQTSIQSYIPILHLSHYFALCRIRFHKYQYSPYLHFFKMISARPMGVRMYSLLVGWTPTQMKCPGYNTKLHLEYWGKFSTSSLPGPLGPRLVVPVSLPPRGQIDQFKNYSCSIVPCVTST